MSPVRGCWINTRCLRGPLTKTHHQKRKKARCVPDRKVPGSGTSPRCSLTASGFCYLPCRVPPPEKHVETRQTSRSAEISSNQLLLQKDLKKMTGGSLGARKRKCRLKPRPFSLNLQRGLREASRARRVELTSASAAQTSKNSSTEVIAMSIKQKVTNYFWIGNQVKRWFISFIRLFQLIFFFCSKLSMLCLCYTLIQRWLYIDDLWLCKIILIWFF